MIFHAPLGLLGALFVSAISVLNPQGGLTMAPFGITERAASGENVVTGGDAFVASLATAQ